MHSISSKTQKGYESFFNGILVTLTAAIAAVSLFARAESAVSAARATVIKPVDVLGGAKPVSTDILVSGITGDLLIRIAGAIAAAEGDEFQPELATLQVLAPEAFAALQSSGTDYDTVPEADLLNGNPVSSIDLQTIYINEAGQAGVNLILAYN